MEGKGFRQGLAHHRSNEPSPRGQKKDAEEQRHREEEPFFCIESSNLARPGYTFPDQKSCFIPAGLEPARGNNYGAHLKTGSLSPRVSRPSPFSSFDETSSDDHAATTT
ncbi:hypothetical protein K0M31_018484 [Melipona bicolor]|uniref:Uncharacterized protein n=1 Tax=Melipona bicolor TaxID=60889 RepID=A0AA40G3P4_9HYME|nr:hypothetical protein K0M31_018484 [Melipona bicolor]